MKRAMRLVMSSAIVSSCVGRCSLARCAGARKTRIAARQTQRLWPAPDGGAPCPGRSRVTSELGLPMAGSPSVPDAPTLRGRSEERAVLDGLLAGSHEGHSGVVVLRGGAGFGKTALLEHAIGSASDLRVLRAAGVEAEVELPFAALHQLCVPVLDGLDRLPGPQRDALSITFGLDAGPVPDRFLVGLSTLSLLFEAAQQRPILCVIDDAQWLDRASAQALAFVARRLRTELVGMLFAARTPTAELAGLPELVVEGLDDADARDLLASVIPKRLDERVAVQLVGERVHRRSVKIRDELTPQEAQIARL